MDKITLNLAKEIIEEINDLDKIIEAVPKADSINLANKDFISLVRISLDKENYSNISTEDSRFARELKEIIYNYFLNKRDILELKFKNLY